MPKVSASWNASLPISLVDTWPVIATIGNRIHHGVDQAGDQVGGAGSGSGAADAYAAGGARIAFGGESGILLVPHQNVPDRMVVQGVVERQRDAARIAEEAVHVLANQAFQQDLRAGHQFRFCGSARSMRGTRRHFASSIFLKHRTSNEKGHRLGLSPPPMAFRNLFSEALQAGPGTAT